MITLSGQISALPGGHLMNLIINTKDCYTSNRRFTTTTTKSWLTWWAWSSRLIQRAEHSTFNLFYYDFGNIFYTYLIDKWAQNLGKVSVTIKDARDIKQIWFKDLMHHIVFMLLPYS